MEDIFIGIYDLFRRCVMWIEQIISGSEAMPYILLAFTAYTVTRFVISPALKGKVGSSDSVRKDNDD